MRKTAHLSVRISAEEMTVLQQLAQKDAVPVSELVRQTLAAVAIERMPAMPGGLLLRLASVIAPRYTGP